MEGRAPQLTVAIRPATAADVPGFAAIEVAAGERFRAVGMDAVADDDPFGDEVGLAAVRAGRAWVAELDGEVVGYALAIQLGGDPGRPHLEQVSVVPEAGGRGAGAALVEAVAAWAAARGPMLTLSTFRDVAWNGPWYRSLGFEPIPEEDLDEVLRDQRAHEAAEGLDVSARCFMRRPTG